MQPGLSFYKAVGSRWTMPAVKPPLVDHTTDTTNSPRVGKKHTWQDFGFIH